MFALHVSYVESSGQEWIPLGEFPLTPTASSPDPKLGLMDLSNQVVTLPNGESLKFSVGFAEINRSVSIHVEGETPRGPATFFFVGGFKSSNSNYDPAANFLTPGGLHVQVMVGPAIKR